MSKGKTDKKKRRQKKSRQWLVAARVRAREHLQEETRSLFASVGKKVSFVGTSGPKLSARILELAEPYKDLTETDEAIRMLIDTAVLAWNIAIKPEDEHPAEIEETLKCLRAPDAKTLADGREILAAMVRRKLKLFPSDRRFVVNHQLTMGAENANLRVVALQLPPGC